MTDIRDPLKDTSDLTTLPAVDDTVELTPLEVKITNPAPQPAEQQFFLSSEECSDITEEQMEELDEVFNAQ